MDDDDFNSYDFDKILAKIQEESLRHYNEVELPRAAALKEQEKKTNLDVSEGDLFKSKVTIKDGNSSFTDFSESLFHHGEDADGFHYAAGKTYIYPSNYPVRKYQADIVPTALFHNTLVSLPTGLGKTFIAAVVMYNFYRWYPMGKVIFMAPTRPLVTQQLSACRDIMGIPVEDTVELTGSTTSGDRKLLWNSKRVFYLTPQVLMNDLRSNLLQASTIKCLVIDEAHRATKGYAYCQVVKILFEENVKFRILALSATPGTDANAVKDVILNLHIEKLEIRSDDSADVVEYSHTKSVIPIIVDLPAFLRDIWSQYMEVYDNYVRKIKELKVLNQNIATMSKFQILTAFRKFSSRPPSTLPKNVVQSINGDFTSCITLAHGRELLQTYGLRTFHSYFTDAENSNDKAASITRLSHDSSFRKLLGHIEKIIFKEDNGDSRQYNWSHPKMEHLVSVVREHFEVKALAGENTKAIIFCQYRLVVTEVYEILKKFVPQAKPVMFIGQSSKEKGQGLPQKKQIEVMKMFRSGEYNVMIATSVAEEGLDIGDVDLIVSMETHRSPIKLVQRFGRTGRKRNGRCVVLLTSGAEVKKFNEVMSTQKNYSSIISSPGVRASLEESSPRMIPQNCNPKLQLLHIKVPKSDKRKQCDIRNVFGKFDTSKTHAASAAVGGPSVPTSAFLTDDEMAQVRDELGSYFPNLNRLPESCELWPRQRGNRLEIEEFASNKFSGYSDWLDWNNELQETHVVGHSRDTKMLVDLLQKASEIKERTDEPVHNLVPSPPASLWSTVGANPNQKKRNEVVKKTKTNGKNQPKSKHGLDIRDCMARVPPPRLGFISQYSTMEDEFLTANKKQATNRNYQDLSAIHETDDVIIIDDDLDRISGDILSDFPELFGQPSYCALSRNKDIRSVVLKCVNLPVKYELNLENFPDICELFEGITIEDVENLDLNELPCFKSISSSNKLSDFENVKKYSGFERIGRYSDAPMYNNEMDFENIEKYSDVKRIDGYSSSPMNIEDTEKYSGAERVDARSSPLNEQAKFENNKKESNIDIEDEDTCMSTESFIVGIDDIFKAINVDIEKDVKSPLKDPTNLDSLKDGCNGFEEKNLSPILSQRTKQIVKVFNGKELGNLSNSDLRENDDDKVGGCRVDENELSPILSQKPQKNLKGFKVSNFNSLKDVQLECGRAFEEKDLSPILSQKPQKMLKGLNEKCFNESNLNSCKNVNVDCSSRFEKEDFSPILSQMPQKTVKGSSERCKRKIEVENVSQPKCSKNADQNLDPYFNDDQEFDEAFLDEFSVEMLNKLSPILSCKTQTFKKPESRCKNKETEQELSPILLQVSGKKSLSKFGESVGEDRIPNLTSSTPKCVKKDLFQNRLQNVTKFNLPQVQEVDTCKNRNLVEVENKEESKEDENEEEEEVWGIDQILGSSKCDEEKSSTVIDPTPPHSPKRLSYYMKGNSLYSVTQLVEKASKLEQNKVIEKEGNKQNKMNEKEVGDEIDEFIINSSDDDFFECADSKIDLNIEAEKRVQQMDELINKSNQSLIEISDESQPPSNKNNTGNENSFVKTEKVSNDDDDDYFEITGLDELMQNCMSNLEKSKSKASTSVAHSKTSEFNMETDMMDSEVDELIENCLDDDFVNSLGKIESRDIDSKVSVEKSKSTNSCRSKFETDKSTTKDDCNKVSDLPNKTEKCSTQFKSDYLSNEELEELLKSGVFNESPIISSDPKLGTTQVNLVDKDENAMNDTEIIDDSNELYLESPLLLSYGSRSDRGLCNTMKSDCLKNNTKFSFLSKSKSKSVLKSGKETQLKPSSASTSRAKESFCGSSGKEIGRKDVKIKDTMPKSDDTFSGGSPDVKGATQENNETKQKIMDDTFSWGSLSIIGARQDNVRTNPKILDERVCLEKVTACRKDIETKCKKSDDSFSWETRDMRGYGLEDSRKESNNLNPSTSATNNKSLVHIDDDSFVSGIKNHCKRRKQKIILSGSSTDMEEDSFPSINTNVERENGEVKKFVKQSTDFESRKSTSLKAPNSNSDSDDSSDIFIVSMNKKSDRSHDDSGAVPSKGVDGKSKKSKKKKANVFIESEADVSGTETSSGKETSGLDSLDESFVDDNINGDNTMMVAHYLQTVKNPKNVAGGFRIPELSESIMARDVYSQYVPMEHETYVNDSFCVNESDSNDESKMSVLEIAEKLLEKRKKSRKNKKAKRKRKQTSSESATDFHPISSQESGKSEEISRGKKRKKRRIVILDDSDD